MQPIPNEYAKLRLLAFEQRDEIERLEEEVQKLNTQVAMVQSALGDARIEVTELKGAIDGHYESTFGHSACFERDEALWSYLSAKDGKARTWNRDSVPAEQAHEAACNAYRRSLFQKPESV